MTNTLVVRALAKINLTLDVLGQRPDGYHDIRSVMQTVALHDTLSVTRTPGSPGIILTVDGPESVGVPADSSNLVHKAAMRLQKIAAARGALSPQASGLHIHLTKHIPSKAGLGGGSSDAASALCAVNSLFGLHLPLARLIEIAASLGADMPFFLTGGTALVEGLGERVTPLTPLQAPLPLIIVKPPADMPTPQAYAALDALPGRTFGDGTDTWLASRPLSETLSSNDFEQVVLPALPSVQAAFALLRETAEPGKGFIPRLCGSGAALWIPCSDTQAAQEIAKALQDARAGSVWITHIVEKPNDC